MSINLEDVFNAVDSSAKKASWVYAREELKEFVLSNFCENLQFAHELNNISDDIRRDDCKLQTLTFGDFAEYYVKLTKLSTIQEDPFRFLNRLTEFMITTPGQALMNENIKFLFFQILNAWIGSFYYCKYGNCSSNCVCLEESFTKAMEIITHRNYTYKELLTENSPGKMLAHRLFGTLFNRAIGMLQDIDKYLPSYEQLYRSNVNSLVYFLTNHHIGFQISYINGLHLFVNVDNQNDKLGITKLKNIIMINSALDTCAPINNH